MGAMSEGERRVVELVGEAVQACRERETHARMVREDIRRREDAVVELVGLGLTRQQVSDRLCAALLEARFCEQDLNRHGVRLGGVRRTMEFAARSSG